MTIHMTKPRTFETTHPWLTFRLDMRPVAPRLWLLLGEAQSKCEHLAGVPLNADTAKRLHALYLAKGALATSAIEGNTLTEEEVEKRIAGQLPLPESKEYLGREIDNLARAFHDIARELFETRSTDITPQEIKNFNRQILDGLPLGDDVAPGELRRHGVTVAHYRGAPAEDCAYLLDRLCTWLNGDEFAPRTGQAIAYGILRAVIAHLYLAWIHPFGDGNGRTARLMEFKILLAARVPFPAAHLLSNHYNQTRAEYYRQLDLASKSGGNPLPFIEYAVQGFVDGLREQIKRVRDQQWAVAWENHVHQAFREKTGKVGTRRRHLVRDLSLQDAAVPWEKIASLTPRLAAAYARTSKITLLRDLFAVEKMELVVNDNGSFRARREAILAFLPGRMPDPPDSR
jgi:Fic family protein